MNNFTQRTLSSVVYAGSVILLTYFSRGYYALIFDAVFYVIMLCALDEFHRLMGSSRFNTVVSMLTGGLLYVSVVLFTLRRAICYCGFEGTDIAVSVLWGLSGMMIFADWIAQLWLKMENPVREWGNNLVSLVMIALPFMLMPLILTIDKWLLLALFVIIWLNDAGAYIIGSLTAKLPKGNHKMFPRVSPAKSWEGLAGGIALAVLTGYIFSLFVTDYSVTEWLSMALLIAVFGNLGDLMESLMKRSIGVKDSGKFLPGHGGVLDRFDSLLLATPILFFMLIVMASFSML